MYSQPDPPRTAKEASGANTAKNAMTRLIFTRGLVDHRQEHTLREALAEALCARLRPRLVAHLGEGLHGQRLALLGQGAVRELARVPLKAAHRGAGVGAGQ